ncbi:MAG TPA: potassium transporter TrkG [Flavisolibacter sp.]
MNKRTRYAIKLRRMQTDVVAFLNRTRKALLQLCNIAIPAILFLAVALSVYDFGFRPFWSNSRSLNLWLTFLLDTLVIVMAVRLVLDFFVKRKLWVRALTIFGWLFILLLTFYVLPQKMSVDTETNRFLVLKVVLYAGILLAFIIETSYLIQFIYHREVSPAMLFVSSFAFLIILGTMLLQLPNATTRDISVLDSLFTSASAVCVTGLVVVDTATHFTMFGKLVILVLIQAGALGIMTFAGLFAYAVTGGASLRSQLAFKDVMSGREVGNIMRFVYQVVMVTLVFEALGAISIYFSVSDDMFVRKLDKLFFAIFHSVSAFSNAGFSTMSNGLFEPVVRFNYALHFFIAILVILGGIGFPIVFNLYRYMRVQMQNMVLRIQRNPRRIHFPKLIHLNSRLALVVTGYLLLVGFILFLMFEQGNSLNDHPTVIGKLVTSFFGSVTPRTAGFNTVDMTALSFPMVMIYLLWMWIGASPGSTGGGIKTTTFGVAVLNMMSVLRGKDRTEFFRSEVSHHSVRRAFAIIFMSLLFLGISIFLVSINDSDKGMIRIAFEVFSAFSTVGLTLGITPELTGFSKAVIIITMFVGRVGTVTLMVAFIRQTKQLYYRYPKEEVTF